MLILEGIEGPLQTDRIRRRWGRVGPSVSNAVRNAREHDGLFLMPAWRTLGVFAELYRGHTKSKAILITAAIATLIALLVVVPADFKLRGEGVIQPARRQHVYAETEGTVERVRVKGGDTVDEGQLLVELRHPELAARVADVAGRLREAEQQLHTLTIQRVTRSFDSEQEEREIVRTTSSIEARVAGLREELQLLKRNQSQLVITSPIAGQVVTWDVEQRLRDRPVKPGQKLMTIAVPSGGWEIELRIPDKRAGYLLKRWQEAAGNGSSMDVSFVLASDPARVRRGIVVDVAPSSNVDDRENENVVRVRIRLSDGEFAKIGNVRPGTTVMGHVHCGRASIGYCKLYEFFDWTQRMWFRFVA